MNLKLLKQLVPTLQTFLDLCGPVRKHSDISGCSGKSFNVSGGFGNFCTLNHLCVCVRKFLNLDNLFQSSSRFRRVKSGQYVPGAAAGAVATTATILASTCAVLMPTAVAASNQVASEITTTSDY